jgi:glutamyl/glutaminyl-tRNA synthetase
MEDRDKESGKKKVVFRAGISPVDANKKIGPLRTHLYNYAFAKNEAERGNDSTIIFRVDDTNKDRSVKNNTNEIARFFSDTLGLEFDVTPENALEKIGYSVVQSERNEIYLKYLEELFDKHVAFVDKQSGLVLFDIKEFIDQYSDTLEVDDLLKGKILMKLEENLRRGTQYFPLVRSDRSVLYHLASVIDDAEFGVTHVVRGQDKTSVAEFQEMVRVAFGFQPKKYLHTPLMLDQDGKLLGGAVKFEDFIQKGIVPQALISYMISSGYGDPNTIYPSLDAFVKAFDYKKIHKQNGKFDEGKLESINQRLVREISSEQFFDSIRLYLITIEDDTLAKRFDNDEELRNLLLLFRKDPEESCEIIKSILNPVYTEITDELRKTGRVLIEEMKIHPLIFPSFENTRFNKKIFYDALRWLLVGKTSFPDIEKVFHYLLTQNLIEDRLRMVEQLISS